MQKNKCHYCGGSGKQPDEKAIGAYNRRKRLKAGVQAKDLAKDLGISPQYLSDLEAGRRHWSPGLRKKYLEALT